MQQGCACVGLIDSGHVACPSAEEFHAAQLAKFNCQHSIQSGHHDWSTKESMQPMQ